MKHEQKISENILPYFTFLLVYIFPYKNDIIVKSFQNKSFKSNQLYLFQLDYLKIRYLGQDFFRALKEQLDSFTSIEEKNSFIFKSQIMEIIDQIMTVGQDPFSSKFCFDQKVSLIGQTIEIKKEELNIMDIEKLAFDNSDITHITLGEQTFVNNYKEVFSKFEWLRTAFLGPSEKIIGIAKNWGEKPFYYASNRIIPKNNCKNWAYQFKDSKLIHEWFLKDPGTLLNLHMNLVGLPIGKRSQQNENLFNYLKIILNRLPLRTILYLFLWDTKTMSIAIWTAIVN